MTPREMSDAKASNEYNGYSNGRVTQKQIGFIKSLLVKKDIPKMSFF